MAKPDPPTRVQRPSSAGGCLTLLGAFVLFVIALGVFRQIAGARDLTQEVVVLVISLGCLVASITIVVRFVRGARAERRRLEDQRDNPS